jgi:hypothetical protein
MTAPNHDDRVQLFFDNYPINPGADWREVVNDLVDSLVMEMACFTSGELARWLRMHRPDLVFSVLSVGSHLRDLFYANGLGQYADDGEGNGPVPPAQVPRTTQGLGRTPAGVEVFVYAPNEDEGLAHPFEVDIPSPGGQATAYPTPPPPPAVKKDPVTIAGQAKPLAALKATVQKDRRLQIPRAAFEMFVHFCGITLRGGDPVYVQVEPDEAIITVDDPGNGAVKYDLWADSGRVSFPSPGSPFTAGDTFLVNIAATGLTVDLTQKV